MTISILKWVVVFLATVNFGYMAVDGARALTKGDYIRPATGAHAGELGPWSGVVRAVGVDPESTFMKAVFLIWGVVGLMLAAAFAMGRPWAGTGMLIISIGSLWYLVPWTIPALLQIGLPVAIRMLQNS